MSDKALCFEDFIVDDYDFNLYHDMDLEYLWEWVELEDFSDLQYGDFGGGFNNHFEDNQMPSYDPTPDSSPAPPPQNQNDINDFPSYPSSYSPEDLPEDGPQDDYNEQSGDENQQEGQQGNTEDEDDFDFDFDFDDTPPSSSPAQNHAPAPQPPNDPAQENITSETDEDDFDFDFDFDDTPPSSSPAQNHAPTPQAPNDQEDDDIEDFDFDENTDDEYDFDFNSDHDGFGDGTFNEKETPNEIDPQRYIETSAGIIDLETDDILRSLQQVDFDEFLSIVHQRPDIYDDILTSERYSPEETEFLRSIEPLVKDPDKVNQIISEQQQHDSPDIHPPPEESIIAPPQSATTFSSSQEMYQYLKEKAFLLAQKQSFKATILPKNTQGLLDNQENKSDRVGKQFDYKISKTNPYHKITSKSTPLPIRKSKSRRYYEELKVIFQNELYSMCYNLDEKAISFIQVNGQTFGDQFIDFLLNKYGTKILFMYQSQMSSDILADRMFDDFKEAFAQNLNIEDLDDYTQDFFRSIIKKLQENNIKF